jgi:2-polyprenyl-3-methyl-5-hydroxy-6-metoxy-1,4-benzoquinol methylase
MKNKEKLHWEQVYTQKLPHEVSWTQDVPVTSLQFLDQMALPKSAQIIDIGGGDSRFVDYLIQSGYENISVLDISKKALTRAQKRLGKAGEQVNWIVADINTFQPEVTYDLWHDRATFHFLTENSAVNHYLNLAKQSVQKYMIVATFSEIGPQKCSGLEVKQYSKSDLEQRFAHGFEKIVCKNEDHLTPFHTVQNFTFCSFQKSK